VRIDRLSRDAGGLIFAIVKTGDAATANTESEGTRTVTKFTYRHPTPAQLYALELSARHARSREQARLIRAGVSAVKWLCRRAVSSVTPLFARAFSRATSTQRHEVRHA
jgi:hypothetical protein